MRRPRTALAVAATLAGACAGNPAGHTLADLHDVEPDMAEVRVDDGLERAMRSYESFLDDAPESTLTPEAMRRLADLKLEKEYGILGDGELLELPAPAAPAESEATATDRPRTAGIADLSESEEDFERRAAGEVPLANAAAHASGLAVPGGSGAEPSGPLEAIELYDRILAAYPDYAHNDRVLYQKARAFDELGRTDEAISVMEHLVIEYPHSAFTDEVEFRRAEYFFTRKHYLDAERAYLTITAMGPASEYYELALYKLGWALYKQDMHEEAVDQYMTLLDHRVSVGHDFDQAEDEDTERRIADTFRVISLSFSYLGGPDAVRSYFASKGQRGYEDRIYSHLGEFYLDKLRYQDAAKVYQAFVELYPRHQASPHFGMRVVEIYETGGFPILVLESKKDFAARYGLQSEYWRHFDPDAAPEVLEYLRTNLEDLAQHYHALYQDTALVEEQPANFEEAARWYRAYLTSFPADPRAPSIHYQLADLLLEHRDFDDAAREYERTAYEHPEHERASAAGYAAIYAHRQSQEHRVGAEQREARARAVESTLRFVDAFPAHEQASVVLGAAIDDLYDMRDFERAIATGRRLIAEHPEADPSIVQGAWRVVAHASFDSAAYPQAEEAYARALEMAADDDDARQALVDNLAASIYRQGELASRAGDGRLAADHYLRIRQAAPGSEIRPAAEYDAAAELIRLEDWAAAAEVLETFRQAYPEHELHEEATRQLAFVRRQEGDLAGAAREYERVAAEADDPELGREALLVAGELYQETGAVDRALAAYQRYVERFPDPPEPAVETHFKIAEIHREAADPEARREQLRRIVEIDAASGSGRTPRIRYLAARAALVLSEDLYHHFDEVALVQPFDANLQEKHERMDAALAAFDRLIDYEDGEITAAATFYMAEVYFDFSQALVESERPGDLGSAELQDYEMALEEEAFPFEERSIAVHEKNLELLTSGGVYNAWIEQSLEKLAERMPGRYAKSEASSGFLTSLERYAYRVPGAPALGGTGEIAQEEIAAETGSSSEAMDTATTRDETAAVTPDVGVAVPLPEGAPEGVAATPQAPASLAGDTGLDGSLSSAEPDEPKTGAAMDPIRETPIGSEPAMGVSDANSP